MWINSKNIKFNILDWARCDEEDDTFRIIDIEENGYLRADHSMQLIVYNPDYCRLATKKEIEGEIKRRKLYFELEDIRETIR